MHRLLSLFTLGLALLGFGCTAATDPQTLDLIRSDSRVLIDVRTPGEFADGHLAGATRIAYEDIGAQIGALVPDKDTPIVLYCRSGRRSGIARQTLLDLGYRQVINAGGFEQLHSELGTSSCKPQVNC